MSEQGGKGLTVRQEAFCQEYIISLNATQAAIKAGYSPKTAQMQSSRLLSNVMVSQRVAELKSERSDRTQINADYVLNRLVEIDQMDVADILNDEGGVKPVFQWPKVWRQFISGFDVAELWEGSGDEREQIGVLKKIKWPDKVKNLELLGKHVDVNAFKTITETKVVIQDMSDDELNRELAALTARSED